MYQPITIIGPIVIKRNGHRSQAIREILAMILCSNAHIARLSGFGFDISSINIYMPKYTCDLFELLRGEVDDELKQTIILDIVKATAHVHRVGLIHGDIKPNNILINDRRAVLADFGLVCCASEEYHMGPVQTFRYRAPEIGDGVTAFDQKIDVFALGCVVYEIIREIPFRTMLFLEDTHESNLLDNQNAFGNRRLFQMNHNDVACRIGWLWQMQPRTNVKWIPVIDWLAYCLIPDPKMRWSSADLIHRFDCDDDYPDITINTIDDCIDWLHDQCGDELAATTIAEILFECATSLMDVEECRFNDLDRLINAMRAIMAK